jgi:hypothetical protein
VIDDIEYEVTQPQNGESADLWGRRGGVPEPVHQPGWLLGGFGVYLNYTYIDSEANYPDRETTRLQGQSEHVGNVALVYEKYNFSGRLSVNYNGNSILEIGARRRRTCGSTTTLSPTSSAGCSFPEEDEPRARAHQPD